MSAGALSLDEAVPLVYVLALRVVEDAGARGLAIKGPVLAAHGLRSPRVSVDVDILVDPTAVDRVLAGLAAIGWRVADESPWPSLLPNHAINLTHRHWPCAVDLHHSFPGFLAEPAGVFQELWARRAVVSVAGVDVTATDAVGSAAIAALHYLRDASRGNELAALATVVRTGWSAEQIAETAELAGRCGAAQTLHPWLVSVGAPMVRDKGAHVAPLQAWRVRAGAGDTSVLKWLVSLRSATWRQRLPLLVRAVRGPTGMPREPTWSGTLASRGRRIARGLRKLPAALSEYRRLHRRR